MGTKPGRWFIGTATTTHTDAFNTAFPDSDRPELADELARMAELFTGSGYAVVPGFGLDIGKDAFEKTLRSFVTSPERHPEDILVVYHTGHGLLQDGLFELPMSDTTGDIEFTSLLAGDLTGRLLRGSAVTPNRVLVILDTCYAAAGLPDLAQNAATFINRVPDPTGTSSVGVIVAARPSEQAAAGAFTEAFVDAVGHASTGGSDVEFLPLDAVVGVVNDLAPAWQRARQFNLSGAATAFLPNPRYDAWLAGFDLRIQKRQRQQAQRRADQYDHALPRAQGLDSPGRDDLWLFTGRHHALADACTWLNDPRPPALVITGSPGSGKSALIGRLSILSDARLRARVPNQHALPPDTVPALGCITRFIHARGMTSEDLLAALSEAIGVEDARSPGELLQRLHELGPGPSLIVAVDAIDEAAGTTSNATRADGSGRFPVVQQVLAPLISAAARTRLRFLLGTRSHLLDPLGANPTSMTTRVLDLDAAEYADPASVRQYVLSCLTRLEETSPYRGQERRYLEAVAAAVSDAAGDSFLVALITARSLALTPDLVNPYDAAWRIGLPREAADAMRKDLDRRLGDDADRARDLLLPLAYARGGGLPWEDIWPRLVTALTGRPCGHPDLDWLIDQAGFYITETTTDRRRSVYRLYHESLAEHLRSTRSNPAEDEDALADTLSSHAPRLDDGWTDWAHAHPYTRTHLATHAAAGGVLDELVVQPRFLLAAAPSQLLLALPSLKSPEAVRAGDAFRRAEQRLRNAHPQDRPAYLQLSARTARAPELATAIDETGLRLTWRTRWASTRLQRPHRLLGHTGGVRSVAVGTLDGRTVLATGSTDGTARLWDAATGALIGDPLIGHTNRVTAVVLGTLDGRAVLATGSFDGTVRLWDTADGTVTVDRLIGHGDQINSLALCTLAGRTVLATGSDDCTARLWDIATGASIGEPFSGHTGRIRSVALGILPDGRIVLATGSDDGTARLWDTATGASIGEPFTGHTGQVRSVALGILPDGRTVLATGSIDGTARLWDTATGTPIGEPFTGHTDWVTTVALGALDGRTVLATGSIDGTARLWDASSGAPIGEPFTGHTDWVTTVALGALPDGRTVLATGSTDGTARLWDATTGAPVDAPIGEPITGHSDWVSSVALGALPDGRTVLATGSIDGTARLWDATTGTPIGEPFTGHTGRITTVALGALDGRTVLATGSTDRTARLWDATTGTPIGAPFTGHTSAVWSVMFGALGGHTVLATGSHDGTVRVWGATTGSAHAGRSVIDMASNVLSVAFAEGGQLAVGLELGVVMLQLRPDLMR